MTSDAKTTTKASDEIERCGREVDVSVRVGERGFIELGRARCPAPAHHEGACPVAVDAEDVRTVMALL